MSDRESCTHHFEHVKQTRPFTEREYMQCTKCGHQNPLGLFQHWDTERDGPVQDYFDAITTESSWTPPRNTSGRPERILTEADYQQAWDAIRAAAKPAIEHTLKTWNNMRHNRPLMNALGIYRLPGDKPLIHNGKKPR